jgi:methyltransferase (TIGR00027 family)
MKRSWTAQGAAAQRAVLTGLRLVDDPYARPMLTPGMARLSWALGHLPRLAFGRSVTLAGAAGSDLWFDAALRRGLDAGIDQVAIIGAGYDSRAWRFARDGVRFFEVDHAASQREKVHAAPGPGPVYVEADLRTASAADALVAAGLDAGKPVFVLVASVSMYLTEEVVRRQFSELAQVAAGGSRLAADFLPASPPPTAQTQRQLRLQRLARIGTGEGFRLGLDPDEAEALVESTGWSVRERTSFWSAARAHLPPKSRLPVDAIDKRKTLLIAVT